LGSFNSSALGSAVKQTARSVAEAAAAGALVLIAAAAVWRGAPERLGLYIGGPSAWAASSISTAALLFARAHRSQKAFWWAFGGGLFLRLVVLAGLMAYGYTRDPLVSQPALLLSYAFGVLFFLLLEYRHIKLK
jgi:hypothetical protein